MLEAKYDSKRFDTASQDTIDVDVLEKLSFDYPGSSTIVEYKTSEFTSVCPWTGLPDFASLTIRYVPSHHLVELKSLKYYLTSFRNVGILQEHVVNRILNDLIALLGPVSMSIEADFNDRGGISTRAVAEYKVQDA